MKILVIDDDGNLNRGICTFLKSNNFTVISASNGAEGLTKFKANKIDIIVTDIQMPGINGLELLGEIKKLKYSCPVIIMTAYASVENAVAAMKQGAEDFLTKPINLQELLIKINKIFENQKLKRENTELKDKILRYEMPEIIGESDVILELKNMLRRISQKADFPVIIYGQSGTGKELVAKNIHFMSDRKNGPFIPLNCAALNDELLESELFGYKKGAFTGASGSKPGLMEIAEGGTILLDEIGEMSKRVQAKLLRVLQDGVIQPIGSGEMKKIDVRFLCASNKELSQLVTEQKFREDLLFRLNVLELEVPSLKSRKGDIPILANHFLEKYGGKDMSFSADSLKILENYFWPGNVRELENLIRMLIVTTSDPIINKEDIPQKFSEEISYDYQTDTLFSDSFKEAVNMATMNFEKRYLLHHLEKNNFNISKTADSINLSRVSIHKKIKEYDMDT